MTQSPIGDNNYEELKKQFDELQKQLAEILDASERKKEKREPVKRVKRDPVEEKVQRLSPDTYVKVMSLVKNPLNLSTAPHGRGKTFRFDEFGIVKSIFYSELLQVIENHPNFFSAGYFYILDSRVIEENNYAEIYNAILTKDQMEEVFSNSQRAIEFFTRANKKQQGVLVEYFVDRVNDGLPVDYNLIAHLSRVSGVDIMKKASDTKDLSKT